MSKKRKLIGGATPYEEEVRLAIERLLPNGFWIKKASKYTESEVIFKGDERLKGTPVDHVICNKDCGRGFCVDDKGNRTCKGENLVAAIEVTTRKPPLTYRQLISENHIPEGQGAQGYLILVVKAEDQSQQQRYVWTTPQVIRQCDRKWEYAGDMYKKWMWVYRVPPEKWNVGLPSLVNDLTKNH